ncbi:MAG: dipeptidase, partial [Planctomycetales bacterium]|nr:dipeptidase [Planctomycetales bacterium]
VTGMSETCMPWNSVMVANAAINPAGCGHHWLQRSWLVLTGWICVALLATENARLQPATAQEAKAAEKTAAPYVPVVVSDEARAIHSRSFVFDGHNDLPWEVRERGSRSFDTIDISKPQPQLHTDIARLHQGGVGAQFWSVYVPAHTAASGLAHQTTLEQIEIVQAMLARYPETFELALTSDDVMRIREKGKIASLIGVEGGHAIENSMEKLRRLFDLGARYMTLTHSDSLDWADSCSDVAKSGGLSEFGVAVVHEMNRLGMMVDISHVSPATMQAALDASSAPVIFSHSSARSVADHPRNVPDEILKQMPADGGVIMVNFYSGFVVPESAKNTRTMFERTRALRAKYGDDEEAIRKESAAFRAKFPVFPGTVQDVADHVDHLVQMAGIDHVGIGSDFDGIPVVPQQLEDVSMYPVLTQVLLDRGYSEKDIHKILSENILRVMREVEAVAKKLQAAE